MFSLDFLRSIDNPAVIIPDFSAGTYALPAVWSGTGWGFNSGDFKLADQCRLQVLDWCLLH